MFGIRRANTAKMGGNIKGQEEPRGQTLGCRLKLGMLG